MQISQAVNSSNHRVKNSLFLAEDHGLFFMLRYLSATLLHRDLPLRVHYHFYLSKVPSFQMLLCSYGQTPDSHVAFTLAPVWDLVRRYGCYKRLSRGFWAWVLSSDLLYEYHSWPFLWGAPQTFLILLWLCTSLLPWGFLPRSLHSCGPYVCLFFPS